MIKIKVSYEYPEELQKVVKLLNKEIDKMKVQKRDTGKYKKAYIRLK